MGDTSAVWKSIGPSFGRGCFAPSALRMTGLGDRSPRRSYLKNGTGLGSIQFVGMNLVEQGAVGDTKFFGGIVLVPFAIAQGGFDAGAFRVRRGDRAAWRQAKSGGINLAVVENGGSLERVLQFAHVARPGMPAEGEEGVASQRQPGLAQFAAKAFQEMVG